MTPDRSSFPDRALVATRSIFGQINQAIKEGEMPALRLIRKCSFVRRAIGYGTLPRALLLTVVNRPAQCPSR